MYKSRYKRGPSKIEKRRKTKRNFRLVLGIGLPVAVFAGIIFLLQANFMQVRSFEISGAQTMPTEDIKTASSNFISGSNFFVVPKSNILFLNKNQLASALLSKFGRLQKVDVSKNFFGGKIDLKITERKPDYVWCSVHYDCYYMTSDGFIFEKINESLSDSQIAGTTSGSPLTLSTEIAGKIIFKGEIESDPLMKKFSTPGKMKIYSDFIASLKNRGINVYSINIESPDKATASTDLCEIIFNPEATDLNSAAENAILLIKDIKSKKPSAQFEYLDVRFGNKIFYKLLTK
jgi:hypothetical protein